MSSEFQSDRIKSDFLNLTFVANDYEINFDKLSEGEEDDQYTGKFRVRSRSVPARRSKEEGMASRRSSSIGEGRKSQGNDRSSNIPQRQGISMVFSEDEMRDSLTGRRHSSMVSGTARGSKSSVRASLSDNEPAQRLSRITEETISSSGASQTEASEEWCTKSLTSRTLHRGKKDPGDAIDPKKMDVIVTAQDTVGLDTVPLVEVRSALVGPDGAGGDVRSHGSMEWIPGQTLHFDVPKEVNKDVEIHLELLPFANPPQGIIDGKMLLNAAEKYEQVQLSSGALGLHVRMKPSKQRGNKKGLKWHPEVRDGKSFTGSNRRNTPFQPLVPIAESEARLSEARTSDGRMSRSMLEDPRMSEARISDGRMSAADPRMSEARMSDGRMSARMSADRWVSDSRMSNGRISNVRMSEARLSDLSEPDLRSSPSLASMQLDVSDLEPRPSCGISTGRRSTVRMQQDPSEASDTPSSDAARQSVGASLNHVGKLSLEAQSGSLFGTLPRSSVRSMQVASSESDSGSGSIGSPGVTTVTPMATIAEDRGTELSSKSARNSMKSRASRLGRRTSDTLPLPGARAVCRFTHPKSVDFCGLELMACQCQAEPLAGRDRSALLVLLEQAAKSVEAARQMKGDASAMPRILAQLSSELTLHGRELRVGRLQTVGVEPVALAVLSQLIEVLDTLVPKANESHENSLVLGHDGSMGGEAKPPYTESLLESLRQAFGPHGFLPEVVECLHSQPQLPAAAAEQLKIQCLLSLRLAAAWETPSSVQKPMELVIQQKGCEVLIQHEELICRLKKGDGSTTVIAQLGLALEIQQLLLCSDLGLEQLCDTFTKARSGATRRETPLATIALETLEILAQQNWQASPVAISTVLPAAVNILALLLNATPVALTASTDQVVRALCELISHETMTPRFISAMLQLVRSPPKPRIWLGSVSNAVQIRKKLRQGLIRNKVPSMVAIAAKEKLAALLQQYGDALLRLDDAGPVSKAVEKRASQVIAAGSYYDTVEAFVSEVYGNLGPVEEEMADFRSAVEDLDDDISRAERRRSSTLVSALSTMRQAIFENCLMPQTRRRSSRGL